MNIIHTSILAPMGLYRDATDEETSKIYQHVTSYYPDGLIYPSVNSMGIVLGGIRFQLDEDTDFGNIGLTKQGYEKIVEHKPFVYWHV